MKPSDKSPQLEKDLTKIFGHNRRSFIQGNKCVPKPIGCGGDAITFRNEISRKEYSLSGLCQKCQDSFFGVD